jgi:hypothetical protein
MKRYHFRTDEQSDAKGIRLASLAAVKCEAAKIAASTICAAADEVWQRSEWTVAVTDDHGLKVLELQIIGTDLIDR